VFGGAAMILAYNPHRVSAGDIDALASPEGPVIAGIREAPLKTTGPQCGSTIRPPTTRPAPRVRATRVPGPSRPARATTPAHPTCRWAVLDFGYVGLVISQRPSVGVWVGLVGAS
jgi:hypothetical protein